MKNIYTYQVLKSFIIFNLLFLISLIVLSQELPNFNSSIGKTYKKINEIDVFKNFKEDEGVVIGEIKYEKKGFVMISNKNKSIILTTEYTPLGYKIVALLEIGVVKYNERVVLRECRLDQKKNDFIIALLIPNLSEQYYTKIRKAWRFDSNKNNFISIPVKGIDCLNEEFHN
jgi:hypothetical protein